MNTELTSNDNYTERPSTDPDNPDCNSRVLVITNPDLDQDIQDSSLGDLAATNLALEQVLSQDNPDSNQRDSFMTFETATSSLSQDISADIADSNLREIDLNEFSHSPEEATPTPTPTQAPASDPWYSSLATALRILALPASAVPTVTAAFARSGARSVQFPPPATVQPGGDRLSSRTMGFPPEANDTSYFGDLSIFAPRRVDTDLHPNHGQTPSSGGLSNQQVQYQSPSQPMAVVANSDEIVDELMQELEHPPWYSQQISTSSEAYGLTGHWDNHARHLMIHGGLYHQEGELSKNGLKWVRMASWSRPSPPTARKWGWVAEETAGGVWHRRGHIGMRGERVVDEMKYMRGESLSRGSVLLSRLFCGGD